MKEGRYILILQNRCSARIGSKGVGFIVIEGSKVSEVERGRTGKKQKIREDAILNPLLILIFSWNTLK